MIPRTLKIRGRTFKVKQVNARDLSEDTIGLIDIDHLTISVYKRLPHTRKVEIVLHEALHGMLDGYHAKSEEAIVSVLCEAIPEFARANPGFMSLIGKQS